MGHVFISYKREDQARVEPLVSALRDGGIDIWWDQDIPAGGAWRETLEQMLGTSQLCLVVWSERSIGPGGRFVREEAERSARRGAYLGVLIDEVLPPLGFGEWQALDLVGWNGAPSDRRMAGLVDAVRAKLAGEAPPRSAELPRPTSSPSPTRRRFPAAAVLLVGALVLAGSAGAWWLSRPSAPAISPTDFVNAELSQMDCTWAEISGVPPGGEGIRVSLGGLASGPPLVRELLIQRAQAQAVPLADVDISRVAEVPQAVCPQLNRLRPFRENGNGRFNLVPERGPLARDAGQLFGLVEVEVDYARLPPHVALLGLDDRWGLEVLIPDLRAHPAARTEGERRIYNILFTDEGDNVRNVALILALADRPLALDPVVPTEQPDTPAMLGRLAEAARAGGWRFELGMVRCGFEGGADRRC
ncbi:MAG TPA: toll/interleukin-1 receptor domain-containing protein [Allosphingosinicella sp.]